MKKIIAILLALFMLLALAVPTVAISETLVAWEWTSSSLPKPAESWGCYLFNDDNCADFYTAIKTEGSVIYVETDKTWDKMDYWNQFTLKTNTDTCETNTNAVGATSGTGSVMRVDGYALATAFEANGGTSADWKFQISRGSNAEDFNVTKVYVTIPNPNAVVETIYTATPNTAITGWKEVTLDTAGLLAALQTEGSKLYIETDATSFNWIAVNLRQATGESSDVGADGLSYVGDTTKTIVVENTAAWLQKYIDAGYSLESGIKLILNKNEATAEFNVLKVYVTAPQEITGGEGGEDTTPTPTPTIPDCETEIVLTSDVGVSGNSSALVWNADNSVTAPNTDVEQFLIKLPTPLEDGDSIIVHIQGTSDGDFRAWLSNSNASNPRNFSNNIKMSTEFGYTSGAFDEVLVFTPQGSDWTDPAKNPDGLATTVLFKAPSYGAKLNNFTLTYLGVFYGTMEEYEEAKLPRYAITVTGGTADVEEAKAGETVTVTATVPEGKVFTGWTAEGVTLTDATATEVSFTMPANAVTLTANYEDASEEPDVPTTKEMWALDPDAPITYTEWTTLTAGSTEIADLIYTDGASFVFELSEYNGFEIMFQDTVDWSHQLGINHWWDGSGNAEHIVDGDTIYVVFDCADFVEVFSADATLVERIKEGKFQICFNSQNPNTLVNAYITLPAYTVTVNGSGEEAKTYAVGETVSITAPAAPEGQVFAGWTVIEGNVTLRNASAATTSFTMPAGNVVVEATYTEDTGNDVPSYITSGGYVIMGDEYHALIGNGIIITTPHIFDANNVCVYCGHYVAPAEDEIVVEVTDPVEPGTEEEEDVTVDVEEPAEDTNPTTGLAFAVVPMLVAALAVVITKK